MPEVGGDRLVVTSRVSIGLDEIRVTTTTSSGPGGQHANRTNSKVVLRFEVASSSLSPTMQARVIERLGPVVQVTSAAQRSQYRNREDAFRRLAERLAAAMTPPTARRPTKPTRSSKTKRLDAKNRRGEVKGLRRRPGLEE